MIYYSSHVMETAKPSRNPVSTTGEKRYRLLYLHGCLPVQPAGHGLAPDCALDGGPVTRSQKSFPDIG